MAQSGDVAQVVGISAGGELPAGPVGLIVLLPDEDEAGLSWAQGIAKEWAAELVPAQLLATDLLPDSVRPEFRSTQLKAASGLRSVVTKLKDLVTL